jgi:hypothetical protein
LSALLTSRRSDGLRRAERPSAESTACRLLRPRRAPRARGAGGVGLVRRLGSLAGVRRARPVSRSNSSGRWGRRSGAEHAAESAVRGVPTRWCPSRRRPTDRRDGRRGGALSRQRRGSAAGWAPRTAGPLVGRRAVGLRRRDTGRELGIHHRPRGTALPRRHRRHRLPGPPIPADTCHRQARTALPDDATIPGDVGSTVFLVHGHDHDARWDVAALPCSAATSPCSPATTSSAPPTSTGWPTSPTPVKPGPGVWPARCRQPGLRPPTRSPKSIGHALCYPVGSR